MTIVTSKIMKTFTVQTMSPQLPVADLDRAIRFYTEKLDFKLDFRYEDFYAGVVKDGCSIHLKLGESFKERTVADRAQVNQPGHFTGNISRSAFSS